MTLRAVGVFTGLAGCHTQRVVGGKQQSYKYTKLNEEENQIIM